MFVYAGIDEAGYGPLLGPLVVARTVFVLDGHEPTLEPPSLWKLLSAAVCTKPSDKKRRLAVNDSKKLYSPGSSLIKLERGLLPFLSALGISPKNLDELLEKIASDPSSSQISNRMYHDLDGSPQIPLFSSSSETAPLFRKLRRAMLHKSIRLADINTAVVFEDRFNQMVQASGSKAECAWNFVVGHLQAIWTRFGEHHPLVAVDRQGGRKNYGHLLRSAFPAAEVSVLLQNRAQSSYRIVQGSRKMVILVEVDGDERHLPAALASMAAKYLRELLMTRFQAFWLARAPEVKPTAGYFEDGLRFLRQIEPLLNELDIDPDTFVRCR